ncbi:MAG: response regulator, partial [Acidobacteriia bacterium]|nr:response regulator [Terriglobia bacterium]
MPEPVIRIVIIEDRREIREGLRTLIAYTAGYECVAAYRSMEEALPEIERTRADVALVDIGLPGMSGIEGIQRPRDNPSHSPRRRSAAAAARVWTRAQIPTAPPPAAAASAPTPRAP